MFAASSCFTGVESTPRIGASEVKRQQAATPRPEQTFLSAIAPQPPSAWQPGGHPLKVADKRIGRVLTSASHNWENLEGKTIRYAGRSRAQTLTGYDATDLCFKDNEGNSYYYRIGVSSATFDTMAVLQIPFTIDLELVQRTDSLLRGQRLFTASADWFDGNGTDVAGLRHIEVRVDSVVPGNHLYPAAVCFTVENPEMAAMAHCSGQQRRFYMSVGGSGVAARTFDRLFSIRNPRRQYPSITDEVWNLIIQSKVQSGMTRDECRLALGSPNDIRRVPTHSGMREIWTYSDGVYFVFDEGLLSDFRL